MGRIKSTLIKRTGEKLSLEEGFSESFESNKKMLGETMPSKRIRNKVAGYISRLKERERKGPKEKVSNVEKEEATETQIEIQ